MEDMMHKKAAAPGNDDILQKYFTEIKAIPLLSFAEELELSKRIQMGDATARKRLIEANLRLVVKIARTFLGSDASLMDLVQEGNIGLMRAAEKYDHEKNVRFSTYANWWIRQSISRYLTNKRRAIRLPHRKEELLRKIQKAYQILSQTLMRQPSTAEIAGSIGIPVGDVAYILNITNGLLSLETDIGDTESTPLMELHEDYTYSPERMFMRKSFKSDTIHSLNRLKEREKRILMYRYQLNDGERHTLKNIGDKMGISPETVRQIELRALRKMRDHVDPAWSSAYVEAI
jgi:RNA polymerase primary sigma factor